MNETAVKRTDLNERREAFELYDKVLRAVAKGKDATVKRKKDGKLCVYEVDTRIAE